jgi:hypothetical protein
MFKWSGGFRCASLPEEVERDLRMRTKMILERHDLGDRLDIIQELVYEVSLAFVASEHKLTRSGRGRPVDGSEKLIAVLVPEVLGRLGIRGSWLGQGDETEDGEIGIVSELESVAQAALHQARGKDRGSMPRPARTSEARKILGKVFRNDPLSKSDPK